MNKQFLVMFALALIVISIGLVIAPRPEGATTTEVSTEMTNVSGVTPGNHSAYAGNVTELGLEGVGVTESWQGYYGNVTGTLELADASGNLLYNWSGADATSGEVYAANQSSVSWTNVECLNVDNDSLAGNVTALEDYFNIGSTDVDGIDETFSSNSHAAFDTGAISFGANACNNTKLYNNAGAGTFDVVVLYDNSTDIPVWTSLISADTQGFNSNYYDFEMIVPEDGHSGDSTATVYYFYVELNS